MQSVKQGCGFNKGRISKFREGSRVRQTPEEGQRTYRPKRLGNNNKDEDNSPKTLNDKNHQASSQKFRQLRMYQVPFFNLWYGIEPWSTGPLANTLSNKPMGR